MYIVRSLIGTIVGEEKTMYNLCEVLAYAKRDCINRGKYEKARLYDKARLEITGEMRRIDRLKQD